MRSLFRRVYVCPEKGVLLEEVQVGIVAFPWLAEERKPRFPDLLSAALSIFLS